MVVLARLLPTVSAQECRGPLKVATNNPCTDGIENFRPSTRDSRGAGDGAIFAMTPVALSDKHRITDPALDRSGLNVSGVARKTDAHFAHMQSAALNTWVTFCVAHFNRQPFSYAATGFLARRIFRACKSLSFSPFVQRSSLISPVINSEMVACPSWQSEAISFCVMPRAKSSEISFFQSMPSIIGYPNLPVNRQTGPHDVQNADMDETKSLDTLGKRLKWARRRAKLTQLQVRKRMNCTTLGDGVQCTQY